MAQNPQEKPARHSDPAAPPWPSSGQSGPVHGHGNSQSSATQVASQALPGLQELSSIPSEVSPSPPHMLLTTVFSIFRILSEGLCMDVLRAERTRGRCLHSSPLGPLPMEIFFLSTFLAPYLRLCGPAIVLDWRRRNL